MRSQAVLLQGDRILLACHERPGHAFWVLPGGQIEVGETPEAAVVREVREETGLLTRVVRLLFIEEPRVTPGVALREPRYTFLCEQVGGSFVSLADPHGQAEKGLLTGSQWKSFDAEEYDEATRDTLALVRESLFQS